MAGLTVDKNGLKRITFNDGDGKRRSIRIGRPSKKVAETFRLRIAELNAAKIAGIPIDSEMARWLGALPDKPYKRIAAVGLVEERERRDLTLGALLDTFFDRLTVKRGTETTYRQTEKALLDQFSRERRLALIKSGDAAEWKRSMRDGGLADATVAKRVKTARMIFANAVRWKLIDENPFSGIKAGVQANADRQRFVDRESVARVMDAAPNAEWRLLIALSRFGGLRVPSEAFALTWADVDFERNRIRIRSIKTDGHGKSTRFIPLFPELRRHVMEMFDAAEPGEEFVLPSVRKLSNPNTQLRRIVERAGLTPWPRIWHNMRATRQTELAAEYPLHTVCSWMGNTSAVAAGHYLQVTDADFERAVAEIQNGDKSGDRMATKAAMHPAAPKCKDAKQSMQVSGNKGSMRFDASRRDLSQKREMTPRGFEPLSSP